MFLTLTLFRMGAGKKVSFSPVRTSPKHFLTFSFNLFATLVKNFKAISSASPKLLNLKQGYPSKKMVFLVKSLKIDIMITSLIEILELQNFGHMTASVI